MDSSHQALIGILINSLPTNLEEGSVGITTGPARPFKSYEFLNLMIPFGCVGTVRDMSISISPKLHFGKWLGA